MDSPTIRRLISPEELQSLSSYELQSGSEIAVIGGGPAGSFFAFYLLDMAERIGKDLKVDIYEPRDFTTPGPGGCNMCGGIVSESLVQNLSADGINLPAKVVQRGIDSYVLHTDTGSVRIGTPLEEKRIGAVHRGPGPRDIKEVKWESFDGHLQSLTIDKGANIINDRVVDVSYENGMPVVKTRKGEPKQYELLAVAVGVNSPLMKGFSNLDFGFTPPKATKTFICEFFFGSDVIESSLGNAMHVFLLNIPRLKFAALIPKGDYVTACMLGEDIDSDLIDAFLKSPEVKNCMPSDWSPTNISCNCSPRIAIEGGDPPFADRIVFIGDSGVTRLYKDGIGAAYRTAKAAATTVVFEGVSEEDFKTHFWPACKNIKNDNAIGKISFFMTGMIQNFRFARKALVSMTADEQTKAGHLRRMSTVMWDMFTGSAPYREIFIRTLHPAFLIRFMLELGRALLPFQKPKKQ
jgi:flavin-dependent dehydrogenase